MPCNPIYNAETKQQIGFVCTGRTRRAKCNFCGGPCDYECDYPAVRKSKTCDQKICQACALHLPFLDTTSGVLAFRASKDYCPTHKDFVFPVGPQTIIVVNAASPVEAALVDRTTPLGNPYRLTSDTTAERLACLQKYKRWLWEQMQLPQSETAQELQHLAEAARARDLFLRCHCAPKPCHAQIVAKAIGYLITTPPAKGSELIVEN